MTDTQFSAVLFDLDGTLVDTAIDMIHALATLADKHQIEHNLNVSEFRQYISKGAVALVKSVFNDPPAELLESLRKEYLEIYQQQLNTHSKLFDGIAEMIKHLDQNQIPWGIVTNKPSWLAKPVVAAINELKTTKVLICADEVGVAKPDPKPLLLAAEKMNINPATTLYLGDAQSDIDGAHNAGMHSAVAMWGYLAPEDHVEEWGAGYRYEQPTYLIQSLRS